LTFGRRAAAHHAPPVAVAPPAGRWFERSEAIMGTAIRVELWGEDEREAQSAITAVMDEMHRIDHAMSPHKPHSELSRINRDAGREAVPLSSEMYVLLERAQSFSRFSSGAFDITFASVGNLYDYRAGTAPSTSELERGRAAIGWQQLLLDRSTRSVRFGREGMRIDLGGFAKGHAVDNGAAILAALGVRHAIVTAGGDSRVIGDRRGRPWTIAIRDPRHPTEVAAVLPLEDVAISTSGDYERYFEVDGVRHHHIVDPRTGRSPNSLHSVTILADDGLTAEALSKTVFVLGLERGMRLVASRPGVDAVVVDAAGRLHYSAGLQPGRAKAAR
jgi:thiamine biosynthesis lipoprotein